MFGWARDSVMARVWLGFPIGELLDLDAWSCLEMKREFLPFVYCSAGQLDWGWWPICMSGKQNVTCRMIGVLQRRFLRFHFLPNILLDPRTGRRDQFRAMVALQATQRGILLCLTRSARWNMNMLTQRCERYTLLLQSSMRKYGSYAAVIVVGLPMWL